MPAKAERRRHDVSVRVRFQAEHDQLVREAAEYAGITISNWTRDRLVRAARSELKARDRPPS